MPTTSAARNRLLFFLLLLQPLTVLMKQTRQAVRAIKRSIVLRCLWGKQSSILLVTDDERKSFTKFTPGKSSLRDFGFKKTDFELKIASPFEIASERRNHKIGRAFLRFIYTSNYGGRFRIKLMRFLVQKNILSFL